MSSSGFVKTIYLSTTGSYWVKNINKPDSSEIKDLAKDFLLLSLNLFSCDSINGSDTGYLNHAYASLLNVLKKI